MGNLDVEEVLSEMLKAARKSFGKKLPETFDYVEEEIKRLGKDVAKIEGQRLLGEIDEESAKLLIEMQINAAKTVQLTGKGIVKVEVEKALNAAFGVLEKTIKTVA